MAKRGQSRDAIPRGWVSVLEAEREHGLSSRSLSLLRRVACGARPRVQVRQYGGIWCLRLTNLVELQRRLAAWRAGARERQRRAVGEGSRHPRDRRGRWIPAGRVLETDGPGSGRPVG